ncbi:protein of unknown function [Methylocella tundrae]|uniref:Uncharacterized protein n=1 Tax=Methylocella tundrae TaxID=227605 RepID=A0A4U8Z1Y8_METTU|nr:protein of unknown function [Methylocella tundrae]
MYTKFVFTASQLFRRGAFCRLPENTDNIGKY